jgi:hypothetical protein
MMEEKSVHAATTERPITPGEDAPSAGGPEHLADPRALTILTTEHWSLLTARSLVYNEAFARAGMFLTFLTGTLLALGFVSQGSGYGPEFLALATALLGFDLFVGLATLGRIWSASAEEFRAIQGMNRLRHAYLEMVPTLGPYFVTSTHDDLVGLLSMYGPDPLTGPGTPPSILTNIGHGLTTTPGMIGTITAAVGGAFAAALVLLFGASTVVGILVGFGGFALLTIAFLMAGYRQFLLLERRINARFPTPKPHTGDE